MIIIEGMDNSGKSTLCRQISAMLPTWQIQVSEGPPKYQGEQNERVKRYLAYPKNTIYDRHPCVSQPIYGQMRTHSDSIDPALIESLYLLHPLFIYCDPGVRGMQGHVERTEVDTPAHVAAIHENYRELLKMYREWALQHAQIIYRIGDPMKRILMMVETLYGVKK